MKNTQLFYWLPRVLAVVFILCISFFALDSFGTGEPWYMNLLGFLIHLIPSYVLVIALIFAWKHEAVGGIVFLVLYIGALFFFRFEMVGILIFSPLILIGVLFILRSRLTTIE